MKKLISCVLSIIMIFSLCAVAAYAQEDEMTFAVASDLHYLPVRDELSTDIDDPIYWYANRRAAMEDESGFIIDEFLKQCAENDAVEFVLLSGDLTDGGKIVKEHHVAVAEKLRKFESETGKQVYVINGNHDAAVYEGAGTTFDDFVDIYYEFGYDEALARVDGDCSYTANLGDKYRLIALDSCHDTASTEDGLTTETVKWVLDQAALAKEDGRYPILMMHHNLNDHLPAQRILSRNFIVKFHYTTATLFADAGIKLVFSGHEHCSDVADYTTPTGNTIYDFATTSLTMYPLTYRLITCTDKKITYSSKTIDSIDTAALLAANSQFTAEQAALMAAGLNDYALGFLKAGIRYRLELSLSLEEMGIAEDAVYYDTVASVLNRFTGLLKQPLYGENSVQSKALEYQIVIPDSNYENLWDLATDLVAMHYEGEESYDLYSDEVTILLRSVSLILKDVLAGFSDDTILSWANSFIKDAGQDGMATEVAKLCTKTFGGITAPEYFLCAIASPLLYEFAFDSDGVNDNNGTLNGYAVENEKSFIENVLSWIESLIAKLRLYMQMFFNIFTKAEF